VYPIKATKKELLAGMRFHVARMISKEHVDITNEKEWERPIKLHRKDPRYQAHANGAMDIDSKEDMIDEKQREALEIAKAERQRIREEQDKQMATSTVQKRKPQAFKKKVEQVYRADDTPEEKKRQQLRYEEALPWHIEDFEEKKIWSAGYEAALSECHVMLVEQPDKSFRLVPLEKWYRFREKSTQKKERIDPEVAEKQMARGAHAPRWLMKNEEKQKQIKKEEDAWRNANLYTRSGTKEEAAFLPSATNDGGIDLNTADVDPDANDIDFNVDEEFADDEENELFEGIDEDTKKMAEEKLKRDQLKANVFDMKDEKEVDEEEETEKRLKEVSKALEKGTRKALLKREKNYDYASDSEGENPYSSSVSGCYCLKSDGMELTKCTERK
jgi:transcription initiation factor TFIIF subunit alpha